ncbi:transcriptional regulator [Enterobacter ludwigii]|uniref:transcriptional regulator n=1 Tax=Enterobacter ludwigii TaxID=299767 RepID=UPI002A7F9D47|nr:transcriptional regulator [Enterobacter ludwigii]
MKAYCKKIDRAFSRLSEGCSERVTRAISLAGTRQKEVEVTVVKQNRTYYRDANPLGNKIHAVQRMKLSSKPLI